MRPSRVCWAGVVAALVVFGVAIGIAPPAMAGHDTVLCMSRTVDNANNPINLRKARPGANVRVWGGAGTGGVLGIGDGSAAGEAYSWSFCPGNANVTTNAVNPPLSGNVGSDRYIVEEVSFTLNASTRETCTATLDVAGITCTVDIDIVDPTHPATNTPLDNQAIDREISVEEGLLSLYLTQGGDGGWVANHGGGGKCAATGFSIWAMHINTHLPPASPRAIPGDIYSKTVDDGRNCLFTTEVVQGTFAANADTPREAVADQTSDCNTNGQSIRLCGAGCAVDNSRWGYSHAIAALGVLTSDDPAIVSKIEDYVDFTGVAQNAVGSGRGGWNYTGPSSRGDGSIDAWEIRLVEGAEICYDPCGLGSEAPDWILQEFEFESVSHQNNAAGPQPFGYTGTAVLRGGNHGLATTAAGLTGLVAIELENSPATTPPGSGVIGAQAPPLNTIQAKRDAGLDYLGVAWGETTNSNLLGFGNRGNFYAMGTVCVANRLTEQVGWHSVHPNGFLLNGGVLFDWETGEEVPGSGVLAPINTAREGYTSFLNRTQSGDGSWNLGTYLGTRLETPLALICGSPDIVLCPGETELGCDPDPRTQGYWHRQCLGLAPPDGIDPGRNGRGPQAPNDPDFEPTYRNCGDQALEDLGVFGETTCEWMDANPPSDQCEKARKQTMAVILNQCSDRLQDGCDLDLSVEGCVSTSVDDLITELIDLINNGDCQTAKDCAGAVNEGDALVDNGGGLVDSFVPPADLREVDRKAPRGKVSGRK